MLKDNFFLEVSLLKIVYKRARRARERQNNKVKKYSKQLTSSGVQDS